MTAKKIWAFVVVLATLGVVPWLLFGGQFALLAVFFGSYAGMVAVLETGVYLSKEGPTFMRA